MTGAIIQCTSGVWRPTGNRRHRRAWFGRLVLQIEVAQKTWLTADAKIVSKGLERQWRDATLADVPQLAELVPALPQAQKPARASGACRQQKTAKQK